MSDITSTFLQSELAYRSGRIKSSVRHHERGAGGRFRLIRRPAATPGATSIR